MRTLAPLILSTALTIAARPIAGQGNSGSYKPVSSAEAELARRANNEIYPRDVQDSLARYSSTLLVWPGIVRQIRPLTGGDSIALVIEHHYFDWKEDHGCQRELYFLSPRGEGLFTLTMPSGPSRPASFAG